MSDVPPASGEVPTLAGGPEAMFRVRDVGGTSAQAVGTMRTGTWSCGLDGIPAPGALGVLVDDVWGGAAVVCAPPGRWGVSTELTVSLAGRMPADGSQLRATGGVVHRDPHAALATGSVHDAGGALVATGIQRTRFIGSPPAPRPSPPAGSGIPAGRGVPGLLGSRRVAGAPGLAVTEELVNPAGNLHGGILFCVAERAATGALGGPETGLAAELVSILYLRPSRAGETIRCGTEVVRRGATAATAIVRCVGDDDRVRALATLQYGPVAAPNP